MTAVVLSPTGSPAERGEQERERVELALHGARMGPRLADRLGLPGRASQVLDAKYEPGASCAVLHRLGPDLVTVVLDLDDAELGDPGGVVVAPGTRAFLFPADPALTGLADAMDPIWLGRRLGDAMGEDLRIGRITLVRYRPAKRATLRLDAWGRSATGEWVRRPLFAKVYHRAAKAEAVHAEARRLGPWAAGQRQLRLATAVALLPEVPMVVHEPVTGVPLDDRLAAGDVVPALAEAAQAMAAFHSAPSVSGRVRDVGAELDRFGRRAAAVARVAPEVGTQLGELAGALATARPSSPDAPVGLVHGDCKPSQFLVGPEGAALLDLDHCGLAEPASDVGTFLATLRQRRVRARLAGRNPEDEGRERCFLEAYAARNDAAIAMISWYQSVALCRKALRAFARSPRSPVAGALGREAEQLVRAQER